MFTLGLWLRAWHRAPLGLLVPLGRVPGAACTPSPCPLCASRAASGGWLLHASRCRVSGVGPGTAAVAPTCHGNADKQQLFLSSSSGRKDQPAIYFVRALNASAGFSSRWLG